MAARALKSRGSGKSIEGMFLYISVSDMRDEEKNLDGRNDKRFVWASRCRAGGRNDV